MLTKEQVLNLLGILATASITGVGFAIGGTIGAAVMSGIGINLSSSIIHSGSVKIKERWLSSNNGILNHDIQLSLVRAFVKALDNLETVYFKLPEANKLPQNEKESIKAFFDELKEQADEFFLESVGKSINEQEIKDYLYEKENLATEKLWERINGTKLLYTYGEHFKNFFRQNLLNEIQFWFSEELKTDNKECNKAWRAFQRLLLEGIQENVKAMYASQDLILQDLKKLNELKDRLDQLKDTIDYRLPNEPFQEGLTKAIDEMKADLKYVVGTTQRIEEKVDDIADDIEIFHTKVREWFTIDPKIENEVKLLSNMTNIRKIASAIRALRYPRSDHDKQTNASIIVNRLDADWLVKLVNNSSICDIAKLFIEILDIYDRSNYIILSCIPHLITEINTSEDLIFRTYESSYEIYKTIEQIRETDEKAFGSLMDNIVEKLSYEITNRPIENRSYYTSVCGFIDMDGRILDSIGGIKGIIDIIKKFQSLKEIGQFLSSCLYSIHNQDLINKLLNTLFEQTWFMEKVKQCDDLSHFRVLCMYLESFNKKLIAKCGNDALFSMISRKPVDALDICYTLSNIKNIDKDMAKTVALMILENEKIKKSLKLSISIIDIDNFDHCLLYTAFCPELCNWIKQVR